MSNQDIKKFLVVNNDPALAEPVKFFLEETFGVQVDLESECSKAIERLTREHYEVVVTNYSTDEIDCFDLVREVSVCDIDTVPIVILPRGDEPLAARCLMYGAISSAARYRNYFRELREAVATALADFVMKD